MDPFQISPISFTLNHFERVPDCEVGGLVTNRGSDDTRFGGEIVGKTVKNGGTRCHECGRVEE